MNSLGLLKLLRMAAIAAVCAAAPAMAAGDASTPWDRQTQAAVRLVAATSGVAGLDRVILGLEFSLAPGWKTYWRSPGEGGLPVEIQWSGSENLQSAALLWPAPRRFSVFGIDNIGYVDHVLLPIEAELARPGQASVFRATVNFLVCKEICVPAEAKLELALPAEPAEASPHANVIARFRAAVPGDGRGAGLTFSDAFIEIGKHPTLEAVFTALYPFEKPDLFVEGPRSVYFAAPKLRLEDGGRRAIFRVAANDAAGVGPAPPLDRVPLTLTLVDGGRSIETVATPASGVGASLALMLLFALLGGAILNLMPCVLPVLSLKLIGLLQLGGAAKREVRLSFLATTAGILASMWALGAAAILGRTLGFAIGWGSQFQQPVFVAGMATLLVLFASNLFGWYEFSLPQALATRLATSGFMGATRGPTFVLGRAPGVAGSFASGAFATLLATPCTAPFLGTALGFAVSRGTLEIVLVFTALGVGFALPYLAVAAMPRLALHLPRPGKWMATLKLVLGLGLLGTALWLLTVLGAQLGVLAALATGALLALAAAMLWLRPRLSRLARWRIPLELRRALPRFDRAMPVAVLAVSLVALVVPAAWPARSALTPPDAAGVIAWHPFAEGEIARAVARGETVFVDVTADWCITCLVNKRLVLQREDVAKRLNAKGVVAMQADWTRPDPAIAAFLVRNRRYGIPFNIVYGPGAPGGVALPEILTVVAVETALTQAQGEP
ncbi:MAG: copper resistance protein [Alphaproteobacteria bacterium]|nr:copper resistance protein [Alphaproteobacteria bacterium]